MTNLFLNLVLVFKLTEWLILPYRVPIQKVCG